MLRALSTIGLCSFLFLSLFAGTYVSGAKQGVGTTAGDVTSSANITDNAVVRGDGGGKGIQESSVIISDGNAITGVASITVSRRSDQGDQWTAYEDSDNGDNYVAMKAPDLVTANTVFLIGGTGPQLDKTSSGNLAADEVTGRIITNRGNSGAIELELPTGAAQMNFIGINIEVTDTLTFDPAATDKIYLNGVALDDGDKIILGSDIGVAVSCFTFTVDGTNYDWICTTLSAAGSVTDGGA